jgi:dTDP-4-dehydrorhamnose reductase
MTGSDPAPEVEVWGGVECTINRVGDTWFDQSAWSGHDGRPDDLLRFRALGLRTLRYPVLWERIAPHGLQTADWRRSDEGLGTLRALGMRAIVGLLHHGSGPASTSLLDPQFPERLAEYARAVAERYPWVCDYTPVNEPLTTARFSGLYGHWYPHRRSDRDYVRALIHQLRGVVLSMRAIREVVPEARLIQTDDCGQTFGTPGTSAQCRHERDRRWLTWDFLTGRVDARHPLYPFLRRSGMTSADVEFFLEAACPPDVIGLNYYLTSDRFLDDALIEYPPSVHGGNGLTRYADVEAVRRRPAGIAGHEAHLLAAWRRYHRPVAITEVHLGCTREEQVRWLVEAWRAARRARARGADVRAITTWALLGSFNWDSLVTRDSGHYEPGAFDIRSPTPRPTAVARAVAGLVKGSPPRHAAFRGAPWWRRPERLVRPHAPDRSTRSACSSDGCRIHGPAVGSDASGLASVPPLLIVGGGTLGRTFIDVCGQRGLRAVVAQRRDVDSANPGAVDALIERIHPWAVVNAAGYTRVGAAEREPAACREANVVLPQSLARACRSSGVPLLMFSSHLVFDGEERRPYTEDDEPRPLSVYGTAKRDAERLVLEMMPSGALVVRAGAFFGGWSDSTYLARLLSALDAGRAFPAAVDTVVTPTYVPDLVHASLDLLVDGERGLWHLTNEGETTWFDFARRAAATVDLSAALVTPATAAEVWPGVTRPRFSALASVRARLMRSVDAALAAWAAENSGRAAERVDECA